MFIGAIAAVQEMNKMSGTYQTDSMFSGNQGTINIQINGELLPRGPLDTLPETYESRQLPVIDEDYKGG